MRSPSVFALQAFLSYRLHMVKIRTFETTENLIQEIEKLLREALAKPGNLMLSGGSTPYAVYDRLAQAPSPVHPERTLFLSDERMVPADSPNNNAGNLAPMLEALGCNDRFIGVDTSLDIEEATRRFGCAVEAMGAIDLGLLGMGTDGHTAGFFTPEQARLKTGPTTLHTHRPDGMQGISVTPVVFSKVERIILLVTGESKRDIIHTLLTAPGSIPAGIALAGHSNVELWTDLAL